MTTNPITPPPELFKQWEGMPRSLAFEAAYRAGADQELEACVNYVDNNVSGNKARTLRASRRPKPPSLNEVALQMLSTIERNAHYLPEITNTIRECQPATTETIELSSDLFDDDPPLENMSASAVAVLNAYMNGYGWLDSPTKKDCRGVAAALRAAADQPYKVPVHFVGESYWPFRNGVDAERDRLLAIAAELDPTTPGVTND